MKRTIIRLIGYGAIIWVSAFIVSSVFIGFGVNTGLLMDGVTTVVMLLVVYFLARSLELYSRVTILKYSIVWLVVVFVLDYLVTIQFTGLEFFGKWIIWVAYVLILLLPLLAVKEKGSAIQKTV